MLTNGHHIYFGTVLVKSNFHVYILLLLQSCLQIALRGLLCLRDELAARQG